RSISSYHSASLHYSPRCSPSPSSLYLCPPPFFLFFFFNDPPPPEIYTLSLHDALPISRSEIAPTTRSRSAKPSADGPSRLRSVGDRKSTRLNSSHVSISYAVFCLKKKKKKKNKKKNNKKN